MDATNFFEFVDRFRAFVLTHKYNPNAIISTGNTTTEFEENIAYGIKEAKIFEIDDKMKKLLALTNPPNKNDEVKLPFPYIFLDVSFTKQELADLGIEIKAKDIIGCLVTEGTMLLRDGHYTKLVEGLKQKNSPTSVGRALRITFYSNLDNGEGWFETFNRNITLDEDFKGMNVDVEEIKSTDKKGRVFMHNFLLSFLNLLYNPEIEIVEVLRSEKNNARRIKQGKPAIPSLHKIKITGKLRQYIDTISNLGHFDNKYHYRFWVRGFYRKLTADCYKIKRVIFVPPFIKGQGILIDKFYKVEDKQDVK